MDVLAVIVSYYGSFAGLDGMLTSDKPTILSGFSLRRNRCGLASCSLTRYLRPVYAQADVPAYVERGVWDRVHNYTG